MLQGKYETGHCNQHTRVRTTTRTLSFPYLSALLQPRTETSTWPLAQHLPPLSRCFQRSYQKLAPPSPFCPHLTSHSPSSSSSAGVEGRGLFSSLASEISEGSFRFTWSVGRDGACFEPKHSWFPTTLYLPQGREVPTPPSPPCEARSGLGTLKEGRRRAPRSPDPKAKASMPVAPPLLAQSTRDSRPGSLSFVFSLSSSLACCLAAFWNGCRQ